MTVVVDTSPSVPFGNARTVVRTPNGNILAAYLGSTTTLEFEFSDDDGATFTADAGATIPGTGVKVSCLYVDVDGYVHLLHNVTVGSVDVLYWRRGALNGAETAITWGLALELGTRTDGDGSLVAHRSGTGWKVHAVWFLYDGSDSKVVYGRIGITSGGTAAIEHTETLESVNGSQASVLPTIDFAHTGDGLTAQASPHLFITWQSNVVNFGGLRYVKATYSGSSWTFGSQRILGQLIPGSAFFDGTRTVVAYLPTVSTLGLVERNASDTATTTRAAPALSDGNIVAASIAYDLDQNVYLYAIGATSDDAKWVRYDRAAGTWGSWAAITGAGDAIAVVAKATEAGHRIEAIVYDGASPPYNVEYDKTVALNKAPTAPTWVTAAGAADVDESLVLDWVFTDPDLVYGDTPSAYALKRTIGATTRWWDGTDWDAVTETWVTTTDTTVTLASGWGADSDTDHSYYVAQKDAEGDAGPYSSALIVTPDEKVNPTVTAPTGTVTAATATASWTVSEQTAFRVVLLNSTSTVTLWDSGWVVDAGLRNYPIGYTFANSTTYDIEVYTKTAEGLVSDAGTNTFTTAFTVPDQPTIEVAESPAGALTVTITNPVEGGETVTTNDLYVRVAAGSLHDGNRTTTERRIATGLDPNDTYTDWAVGSGVTYEYMVRAWAANGTYTDSEWTESVIDAGDLDEALGDFIDGGVLT